MCRQTSCEKCGKTTWAGCGAHVDAVMAGVPVDRRCQCARTTRPSGGTTHNIGRVERSLRAGVGLVAISLVVIGPQTGWGWLGLIPLMTAAIGFCPLYRLLGFTTVSKARDVGRT